MATYTTNINLKKPSEAENFTVADANTNAELIDTLLATKTSVTAVDDRVSNIIAQSGTSDTEVVDARQSTIKGSTFATLDARLEDAESDLATLESETITGTAGKKYKIVACVLRNTAGVWAVINDSSHTPVNVASVSQTVDDIRIDYTFTATKVISLVACPDDTYVQDGLNFGASVGTTFSLIRPIINKHIGGYISYNGSAWVISNAPGVTSAVWTTDKLVVTHGNMYQQSPNIYNAQVTHRDGNYIAQLGSNGLTTLEIKFYDFAGTLVTTPNANMKFYFDRTSFGAVRTQDLLQSGSNIWVFGVFEVA